MKPYSVPRIAVGAASLSLLLAACGGSASKTATTSPTSAVPASTTPAAPTARTLTVFLAGSLNDSFTELGKRFETDNPGVTVKFNSTAASADLASQIVAGTPADVFASAGDAGMKTLTDAMKADGSPVIFATNVLEIATAPGNPKGIGSLADLAKPGVKVAVCEPKAACGVAAVQVEQAAGVTLTSASEEASLKAVITKITTGGADAGLVYITDVVAAKATVQGVMFQESSKAVTNYPIAVVKGAAQADLAKKFVQLVTGSTGQTTLKTAGFGTK